MGRRETAVGRSRRHRVRPERAIVLHRCLEQPWPPILKDQEQRRSRAGPRIHFESVENLLRGEELVINRVLRGRIVA